MDSVIRVLSVYFFLLIIFRVAGKRTLAEMNSFDLVLALIISETTQQAMVDEDHSLTNGFLLITTLVFADFFLSLVKEHFPGVERWLEGTAILIMENGRLHKDRMARARVDENDILEAARELQGLERLDQIKYAILERSGKITVVPKSA